MRPDRRTFHPPVLVQKVGVSLAVRASFTGHLGRGLLGLGELQALQGLGQAVFEPLVGQGRLAQRLALDLAISSHREYQGDFGRQLIAILDRVLAAHAPALAVSATRTWRTAATVSAPLVCTSWTFTGTVGSAAPGRKPKVARQPINSTRMVPKMRKGLNRNIDNSFTVKCGILVLGC